MSGNPRIDELKRRVQQDPASIAFAALADGGPSRRPVPGCGRDVPRGPAATSRLCLGARHAGAIAGELGGSRKPPSSSSRCCAAPPKTWRPSVRSRISTAGTENHSSAIQAAGSRQSASQTRPWRALGSPAPCEPPRQSPSQRRRRSTNRHSAVPLAPPSHPQRHPQARHRSADSHHRLPGHPASEPEAEEPEIADWSRRWLHATAGDSRARTAPRRNQSRQTSHRRAQGPTHSRSEASETLTIAVQPFRRLFGLYTA